MVIHHPSPGPVQSLDVQAQLEISQEDCYFFEKKLVRVRCKLRSGSADGFQLISHLCAMKVCFLSDVAIERFQRERQQPYRRARKHTRELDKRDGTGNSSSDPNSPDNCLITACSAQPHL